MVVRTATGMVVHHHGLFGATILIHQRVAKTNGGTAMGATVHRPIFLERERFLGARLGWSLPPLSGDLRIRPLEGAPPCPVTSQNSSKGYNGSIWLYGYK
jgi:hypothetical protein